MPILCQSYVKVLLRNLYFFKHGFDPPPPPLLNNVKKLQIWNLADIYITNTFWKKWGANIKHGYSSDGSNLPPFI